MVEKYIIDKADIHDLLAGKELPLSQGKARAFCVEIAGNLTNGDMIKAMFPDASFVEVEYVQIIRMHVGDFYVDFNKEWWNASYK